MRTRTHLKIAGAVLSATVLAGGHALTAHADSATDLVDAATVAAEMQSADVQTWTNPNVTCGPEVNGQSAFTGLSGNVNVLESDEFASADVTCFSFTATNYTLNATLSVMEYDAKTKKFDITVCAQAGLPFNAVDGLATVRFPLMQCQHTLGASPAVHTHIAVLNWSTTIPGDTPGTDASNPWTIVY